PMTTSGEAAAAARDRGQRRARSSPKHSRPTASHVERAGKLQVPKASGTLPECLKRDHTVLPLLAPVIDAMAFDDFAAGANPEAAISHGLGGNDRDAGEDRTKPGVNLDNFPLLNFPSTINPLSAGFLF